MLTIWQLDRANWTKLILVQWTPLFNSHRWMLFYCINVDRTDEKKVCANFVNDANGIPSEKQTLPFVWVLHRWEPLKWFHVWEIYIFKMDFNCANWLDVGGVSIQFILNVRENSNLCIKLLFVIVIAFTFSLLLLLLLYLPSSYASIFLILVSWYWLNNMVRQQWGKETTSDSDSLDFMCFWQGCKGFAVKV